ncbi:MAG TPA: ATP-binding protein [Bacteroidales bacterium]|nr:ATP-binding protein [Bacteroidales bacterium]
MILKETIVEILHQQDEKIKAKDAGIPRQLNDNIAVGGNLILIISGIRRCGKSTLLNQIKTTTQKSCYFNFEDILATDFELSDFKKLDSIIKELYPGAYLFFDEIQVVEGWENYARSAQDDGFSIIITGSNASLLSRELGTKLTGRHLTYELFPFSYAEFLVYKKASPGIDSFSDYFITGGFPEYIKHSNPEILQQLLRDILNRDIIVRHGLKNSTLVGKLATFLMTNAGKKFSYNSLMKTFETGSANTIIDYVSYFEDSYLLLTIPSFSYSIKDQIRNPKKIYSIDHGMARVNSLSFSKDEGRILENMVFLHLRRKWKKIYYYSVKSECDFVVFDRDKVEMVVQVCYELSDDNMAREISGLKEALDFFQLKTGFLISYNQEDVIEDGERKIIVMPAWKWMMEGKL